MRIGFLGKGGSGKTTVSAAFARHASGRGPVLAVDADLNIHLQRTLGMEGEAIHLGHRFDDVAAYLRGSRTDLGDQPMIGTTPPSLRSRFIRAHPTDEFLARYALIHGNVRLLTVGSYRPEDVGAVCYHGKLGVLELILHHLLDRPEDVVVADATAGVDNLGTSLSFAYDLHVFVVEPTRKSVDVYLDFLRASEPLGLRTCVLLNKVESPEDLDFARRHLPSDRIVGSLPASRAIRRMEQGEAGALDAFAAENAGTFDAILSRARSAPRDWDAYYRHLLDAHRKVSAEWYDAYYGAPVGEQRDPGFAYQSVLV